MKIFVLTLSFPDYVDVHAYTSDAKARKALADKYDVEVDENGDFDDDEGLIEDEDLNWSIAEVEVDDPI